MLQRRDVKDRNGSIFEFSIGCSSDPPKYRGISRLCNARRSLRFAIAKVAECNVHWDGTFLIFRRFVERIGFAVLVQVLAWRIRGMNGKRTHCTVPRSDFDLS